MKKLFAPIATTLAFLTLTSTAFAQFRGINLPTEFGKIGNYGTNATDVSSIIEALIALIFIVAVVIALFFLLWGAVRWILSGGDKAAVEAARHMIIAAVVGLIVLFLAFLLLNVLLAFFGVDIKNVVVPTIKK